MKYYLKICGVNNSDETKDFIKEDEECGSTFWEDKSVSWLGKSVPQINIGDIFIQYAPGRELRSHGVFKNRILGYYEVVSREKKGNLENHWFRYVELKNLSKEFSVKAKQQNSYAGELHIGDYDVFKGKTIQSGAMVLEEEQAKILIDAINGIPKPFNLKFDFDLDL
jgi:hypothetical protein